MESNKVPPTHNVDPPVKPVKPKAEKLKRSFEAIVTKVVELDGKYRMHLTTEAPEGIYQIGNANYHLKHTRPGFAILTGSIAIRSKKIVLKK